MSISRTKLIDEIFSAALALSGDERRAYLFERCGDDDAMRSEVEQLLGAADSDDELDALMSGARDRLMRSVFDGDADIEDLTGQRINHWQLEQQIARGGLATVYKAQRIDGEFQQTAAFKVLRRGLDTDDLIARFRAERQILSTLKHPAIAQILDGGALDDGRPYLVLEFVDGVSITEYCAAGNLGVRDKVILVIEVLRALHHAHQHLVVHRDVKPSNILVSADGNVSLLDFGIAKLLDPESMPGASALTRTGVSLLTPGYGSPEQHAGETVTTASDVYQVGLVLYELLTGQRPFEDLAHRQTRTLPAPSRSLQGKPGFRAVQGDLDAIVGKATHSDRTQRYSSANEMVVDLRRFLDGLPVVAQPDSVAYRLKKLLRRNPWLLPVVAVALAGIVAYVITLTRHNQELQVEQRRAAAAQEFLVDVLRSPDPFAPADTERGSDITVVEALDIGVERLQSGGYEDPVLRLSLLTSIADVFASLDQHQRTIDLREEAMVIERELYGDVSEPLVETVRVLANQYWTLGDNERAAALFEEQLNLARAYFGDDSPEVGIAEAALGSFELSLGNAERSEELLQSAANRMRRDPEKYARPLINAEVDLAYTRNAVKRDETLAMLAETMALANAQFGEDSLFAALVHAQLATTYSSHSEFENSEKHFLIAIDIYERRVGRNHGSRVSALNNLGVLYVSSHHFDRAEQIHRELLQINIEKYGEQHRAVASSYQNLATAIYKQGRYDEAIPLHRKAIEIYRVTLNDDNPLHGYPLLSISTAELQRGNPIAAESAAREALAIFKATPAAGSMVEGIAACLVGVSLEARGLADEGRAVIRESRSLLSGGIPDPYTELCLED